jgi:hypothetical protein
MTISKPLLSGIGKKPEASNSLKLLPKSMTVTSRDWPDHRNSRCGNRLSGYPQAPTLTSRGILLSRSGSFPSPLLRLFPSFDPQIEQLADGLGVVGPVILPLPIGFQLCKPVLVEAYGDEFRHLCITYDSNLTPPPSAAASAAQ